jgi:nicotinamide mononucleotide transporter
MSASAMSPLDLLEWAAVLLNILFTILIAYERRIGWVLGFVASSIGVGLYLHAHTWAMSVLNGYYVVMAVYGWWSWGRTREEEGVRVQRCPFHILVVTCGILASWAVFLLLAQYLNGSFPRLDAFVTVFSFIATWMMARKYLVNWLYFMVADSLGIWLNWRIGYEGYALLNAVYLVLSVVGYLRWVKQPARRGY